VVLFRASTPRGAPLKATLRIAIVDRSVLERFASDRAAGHPRWLAGGYFDRRDESIGGISLRDLSELDPAKIDGDYGVYALTTAFPKQETYGLSLQMRRASVSIPANIAEGFRRRGKADKARFMNMAEGSVEECRYFLILAKDLGYGDTR
jgi:hypothetical protein